MSEKVSIGRRLWYATITAIILQSVWIGGGYGTGREVVEFIAKYGALGWISILVGLVSLLIALVPSFEIARVFKAFDYMTWSKQFLWKAWPIFDIAFILLSWIVIAVVGAAAAAMLEDMIGIPYFVGALIVILSVGLLHFFGRKVIEGWWIVGTVGLYIMYAVIWALTLYHAGPRALENISKGLTVNGDPVQATVDGFRYTLYNLCVVMPALQSIDRYKGRLESFFATLISLLLVYGAAALIWICFMGFYPEIINEPVPWYAVLKSIGAPWAMGLFVFWIFYTLIETALGMIYAIVRRVDAQLQLLRGRRLTRKWEAVLAVIILAVSLITAQVGIVALVAQGYGTMAWVFFAVYFVPIVTIGVTRLLKPEWAKEFWSKA